MDTKSIEVEVLEFNPNQVKVKVPFLDIPINMNHEFFNKRVESGYFSVPDSSFFQNDYCYRQHVKRVQH